MLAKYSLTYLFYNIVIMFLLDILLKSLNYVEYNIKKNRHIYYCGNS